MEAKDVALLGFVKAAQEYVEKNKNDKAKISAMENVDIDRLDKELSSQLKFLNLSKEEIVELVNDGRAAFEKYRNDNLEVEEKKVTHNVIDELGEIFNLDDINEKSEYEIDENDDVLNAIANAASKSDEELYRNYLSNRILEPEDMDETYADVINNEQKNAKIKKQQGIIYPKKKNNGHIPLSKILKEIGEDEADITGYYYDDREEMSKMMNNLNVSKEYIPFEKENIITNPALDIVLEREQTDSKTYYDLAGSTNVDNEKGFNPMNIPLNPGVNNHDPEVSKALLGLSDLQRKQEKKFNSLKEDPNELIYKSIMESYPYLNKGFIRAAYERKGEIESEVELNEECVLLHRILFNDIDELRQFVEILVTHNYSVNVDERKMIVDTFRKIFNQRGNILTNILSIANQAKIVNGMYEGYRVITIEKD